MGNGEKSILKINMLIELYLRDLTSSFLQSYESFFESKKTELDRLKFINQAIGLSDIYDNNKFISFIMKTKTVFSSKYMNKNKNTINLYSKYSRTKAFNNYMIQKVYYNQLDSK